MYTVNSTQAGLLKSVNSLWNLATNGNASLEVNIN